METINFMSLQKQCEQLKGELMGVIEEVYDSNSFVGGPYVKKFEESFASYIGAKYCTGVSNGTDALFLACKALGIKEGDEVIVPSNTFIASAWAPLHCGAKVVFADCKKDTWLVDPVEVQSLITPLTKAVVVVHLYGQPAEIKEIADICKERNIALIEDCAQAHGASWGNQKVGTFGDLACFSFYPGKNLGAFGDAGAIVSNNFKLIEKINMLKDHGCKVRYHHDIPGYNMRLDGIQAAILTVKLKHLPEWTDRRISIAKEYRKRISNKKITLPHIEELSHGVYHLFVVLVDDREKFMQFMKDHNINCGIHYPIPCHLQNAFGLESYKIGDLPNTEYVMAHCVSLPIYPELSADEQDYIIKVVNSYE